MNSRRVSSIHPAHRAIEGDGMEIRRPFPVAGRMQVDPFLLFDRVGPKKIKPGEARGVPPHPHRGFEIISYLMAGELDHTDSKGNAGALRAGDMQWMRAGDGVLHKEMPSENFLREGGHLHAIQLWINLPSDHKRDEAAYRDISARDVPTWTSPEGEASIKVLAGDLFGLNGPARTQVPILYLHLSLKPGAKIVLPVPPDDCALVYGLSDGLRIGAEMRELNNDEMALLSDEGEMLRIQAHSEASAEGIVLAGKPIREPMVRYGPFVMNHGDEIETAIRDYRAGRFGSLDI